MIWESSGVWDEHHGDGDDFLPRDAMLARY